MAKDKSKGTAPTNPAELVLVRERKFVDLLPSEGMDQYEASGVYHLDGHCLVVFDNLSDIAKVRADLSDETGAAALHPQRGQGIGYEDITFNPELKQWYCLVESAPRSKGVHHGRVEVFTEDLRYIGLRWLNWAQKDPNKGFEGLSVLVLEDQEYVLALCEGNACKSGSAGREPGKGRIQVFHPAADGDSTEWDHVGTVKLPKHLPFEDYSALDARNRRVTVVSQESSMMWVGRVREDASLEDIFLDDLFVDEGTVYRFPCDSREKTLFCNVEGVSWIDDRTLVVVSDRFKAGDQHDRCRTHDQSIHIFRLPDDAGSPQSD